MSKPQRAASWIGAVVLGTFLTTSTVAAAQPGRPQQGDRRESGAPGRGEPQEARPVLPGLPGPGKGGEGAQRDGRGPDSTRDGRDGAGPQANPLARILPAPRPGSRDDRRRQQREEQRPRLAALGVKPIDDALRGELRRHAEMVARLDRIVAIAVAAKDEDSRKRAQSLRDREQVRHDAFLKGWR